MSIYEPFERHQAELINAALAADAFRFDASDLMPPEIGADLFWKAMMRYAAEGPDSLDAILAGARRRLARRRLKRLDHLARYR